MHNFKPESFRPEVIQPMGKPPRVIMRRARSAALSALPPGLIRAADVYAATAEAVAAGGASLGHDRGGSTSGGPSGEGRQFHAVKLAEFLRKLDAAVGCRAVRVEKRGEGVVGVADLWAAVVLRGYSLTRLLESRGFKRGAAREAALRAALIGAAERVADAMGQTKNPWAD